MVFKYPKSFGFSFIWISLHLSLVSAIYSNTKPIDVHVEHHRGQLGIGESLPRISWIVDTTQPSYIQKAYEIEVIHHADREPSIETFQISSNDSVLVPWPSRALESRERAKIRVRCQGGASTWSEWSETVEVETGLLNPEDWTVPFIHPSWNERNYTAPQPVALLRRSFSVPKNGGIDSARLYITANGIYEAFINGQRVGDAILTPGWQDYNHRLAYQSYDATRMLKSGDNEENIIGVYLAEGWYTGRLGWGEIGKVNIYGNRTAVLAQLEVKYRGEDEPKLLVGTDERWRSTTGPFLTSGIYDGEVYDARLEKDKWALPGFDDSRWSGVAEVARNPNVDFVAPTGPPVRRTEIIKPLRILTTPKNNTVIDFGQNLVGRVFFNVTGPRGQKVVVRHAEVLENGEIATRPLRSAKATASYTLRGTTEGESYEPHFTYFGFRYVEVNGWPGKLSIDAFAAAVYHNDMKRTGWFETSEPLFNKLHENARWGMRGNFFYVPTDCPQRNERLGWTGDIGVFAPTASFLYESVGMLSFWLRDLATEQMADSKTGRHRKSVVPLMVPRVLNSSLASAVWGDAAVIIPWVLYNRFGDVEILQRQYESMSMWVKTGIPKQLNGLWSESGDEAKQLGDWLDPLAPSSSPGNATTDKQLIANAYLIHSAEILFRTSKILGKPQDTAIFSEMVSKARSSWQSKYILSSSGRLSSDTQTGYSLAIEYSLFQNEAQLSFARSRLAEIVRNNQYRIGTGFVGTPILTDALSSNGNIQYAYRLLLERNCPSWLYPITMGATTPWERWDSMLPDGRINPGEMTSFNHYALSSVVNWMYKNIGGIINLDIGWRKIRIAVNVGGGLTWGKVRHDTPYGELRSEWSLEDNGKSFVLDVKIPANTQAEIVLPGEEVSGLGRMVGSGEYHFRVPFGGYEWPPPQGIVDPTMKFCTGD